MLSVLDFTHFSQHTISKHSIRYFRPSQRKISLGYISIQPDPFKKTTPASQIQKSIPSLPSPKHLCSESACREYHPVNHESNSVVLVRWIFGPRLRQITDEGSMTHLSWLPTWSQSPISSLVVVFCPSSFSPSLSSLRMNMLGTRRRMFASVMTTPVVQLRCGNEEANAIVYGRTP